VYGCNPQQEDYLFEDIIMNLHFAQYRSYMGDAFGEVDLDFISSNTDNNDNIRFRLKKLNSDY
jgi:hypothetical protein